MAYYQLKSLRNDRKILAVSTAEQMNVMMKSQLQFNITQNTTARNFLSNTTARNFPSKGDVSRLMS